MNATTPAPTLADAAFTCSASTPGPTNVGYSCHLAEGHGPDHVCFAAIGTVAWAWSDEGGTTLSPTLRTIAALDTETAHYWGSEAQAQYGQRVYETLRSLSALPRPLIAALGTAWKSLLFADDIRRAGAR